ncbi:interferon gamma receptor 2 isoform X2 [Sardina pilchardus]|uniref:interferon gamma receptor 2 isoform X2 n=1 Tax=Sardina pilchardus TaxID=27697 RepID=UPI002E15BBE2
MNTLGFFIFCAASLVLCRALEAPPPPYDVDLKRTEAILEWSSHTHTATYTVQYRIRDDGEWCDLRGCVNTVEEQCDFSANATHLYGAALRVHARQHNASSPWQQSQKRVACVHTGSCSPEVVVMVSPGYLSVLMDGERSDQSLQREYGGHLRYSVLYGREGHAMEVFCDGCASAVRVEPLPVGERWCVQVRYLLYSQPHGSLSKHVCHLIPQSERERDLYLAGSLAGVFLLLVALSIGCYYFIKRHHTHIKEYIRPCGIPEHFIQISPGQPLLDPSAEPQSHDLISSMVECTQEEDVGATALSQSDHPTPVEEEEQEEEEEEQGEEGGVGYRDYEGSGFSSNTSMCESLQM